MANINEDSKEITITNSKTMDANIRKWYKQMDEIQKRREDLSIELELVMLNVDNCGMSRKGFKAAYKRRNMDPEKRDVHDITFATCCNAEGIQYQADLFKPKLQSV